MKVLILSNFRMSCKKQLKLKKLIKVCVDDKLFSASLKSSVFRTFLEVLKNCGNRKFEACFSKETHKRKKRHKKIIHVLLSRKRSWKKRKKIFIKSPKKFRKFVYVYLLKNFFENCVEIDE